MTLHQRDQLAPCAPTKPLEINLEGCRKSYPNCVALDGVDLQVRPGEFLTLLGPSGSGKTTLLMALAGFESLDAGEIFFDERNITREPPHKRGIGVVFQNYALFPHMDVAGNVAYPLKVRGVPSAERERRIRDALSLVDLTGLDKRQIGQLSGGQRQRVALARAIVFEPRLLLMDEPLSALDKNLREHMQIEIKRLHRQLNTTIVYVTHDQREALTMSDRVAVFHRGNIRQVGAPAEIYDHPIDTFVASFLGESSLLPVKVLDNVARLDGKVVFSTTPPRSSNHEQYLILRPEKIQIVADRSDLPNVFECTITDRIYQGEAILIEVVLASGQLIKLRQPTRRSEELSKIQVGGPICIGLHPDDVIIAPSPERSQ